MQQTLEMGPVEIRYAAALRGIVPPEPGRAYVYVRSGPVETGAALALAASNPDGQFYFIMDNAGAAQDGMAQAAAVRLKNCAFITAAEAGGLAEADYYCATPGAQTGAALAEAQDLARRLVKPGGLFVCRYAPFDAGMDGLRFMVAEFAPELAPEQYQEFLHELKQLGQAYFSAQPEALAALDAALGQQKPEAFLRAHGLGLTPRSPTVQMIGAMQEAGFSFAGDATIQANYLEMMAPKATQEVLYALRAQLLYEAIKDFATARAVRTDIWARQAAVSGDAAVLFGRFYFGLAKSGLAPEDKVTMCGQVLDLTPPLFQRLIDLMRIMPVTIGDFLDHPSGRDFTPPDVMMAMHVLVAYGVAVPMRASFPGMGQADYQYPRLAGQYNQRLRGALLQGGSVMLASAVAGRPVQMALPEALVLQAVDRVGLAESVTALMPELVRVSGDPGLAASVFGAAPQIGADFAESMVKDVCSRRMVDWYALGILDAA